MADRYDAFDDFLDRKSCGVGDFYNFLCFNKYLAICEAAGTSGNMVYFDCNADDWFY